MNNNSSKKAFIFYFLMCLILLDFGNSLRKLSFNSFFDNYSNPVFSIVHTTNTGSAFGMFSNNSIPLAVFGVIALVLLTYYVYKNIKFEDKLELLSITLFSAGALGNLVERAHFGYVVDYIKLNFTEFPVFNAFDIMICLGVFLYFLFVIFDLRKDYGNSDKSKQ
ncbi:MAG: signal peptidase II [Candidatus Gastranaerophilales bacterium]|nr:signal peptidase II [Candidatus Gastranaerophilales bacterium]